MKLRLLCVLVVLGLLAGCITPEAEGDPRLSLADLSRCHGFDLDGASLQCENQVELWEMQSSQPSAGWLCVDSAGADDHGVRLWWNPVDESIGFEYRISSAEAHPPGAESYDGAVSGFVAYETAGSGETGFFAWNHASHDGFQIIPDLPATGHLSIRIFSSTYDSDTPQFQDGVFRVNWTYDRGEQRPVRILDAAGGTFHFPTVIHLEGSPGPNPPFLFPTVLNQTGSDFAIEIRPIKLLNIGFDYSMGPGSLPACGLGLPASIPEPSSPLGAL